MAGNRDVIPHLVDIGLVIFDASHRWNVESGSNQD
jgi:hypothetical protein